MRFPKSLFGYQPQAVDRQIAELEASLGAASKRAETVVGTLDQLRIELTAREAELGQLRMQRLLVTDRLITADEEARTIRTKALEDAEALRSHWRAQAAASEAEVTRLNTSIQDLRREFRHLLQTALKITGAPGNESASPSAEDTSLLREDSLAVTREDHEVGA